MFSFRLKAAAGPAALETGQEVCQRLSGEFGVVRGRVRSRHGGLAYEVDFDTGRQTLPPGALSPVYPDPFELLAKPQAVIDVRDAWLHREARRLRHAFKSDPATVLSNSRVEPQHHQVGVLSRALAKTRPRLILADEVGLGKTIEAGLILKELRAQGALERVLVISPASLVSQWVFELGSKFNERFTFHDGGHIRSLEAARPEQNPWAATGNVICSRQLASREEHRERIAAVPWDLVIVDEAHHARRHWNGGEVRANQAYRLLEALRDRVGGLLLLTATPMQLHDFELYSMVELVEPGLFLGYNDFVESRADIAKLNRHLAWLRQRTGKRDRLAERDLQELMHRTSAPNSIYRADLTSAEGRERVADWLESRHRLASAMVRNRKSEIGGFRKRIARRIPVVPNAEEIALEAEVLDYIRRQHQGAGDRRSTSLGLVLTTFRKLLASSTDALATALENRAARLEGEAHSIELTDDPELAEELKTLEDARPVAAGAEVAELRRLAGRARSVSDSKLAQLESAVERLLAEHPDEKVLIFTQFLGTLELIRERLEDRFRVAVFHGGMTRDAKDAAHRAFKGPVNILISSEAGGEGRNFQFCHVLVNYDLPWNPMRIEQRIGRLDRVGQQHDIQIYNFALQHTLDERILNLLEERIRVFSESVGALEPILGELEDRLARVCLADLREAKRRLDDLEVDIESRVRRAREQERQMRDLIMDRRSLRRDEVDRLLGRRPLAGPKDLERFTLTCLARHPTSSVTKDAEETFEVTVPDVLRKQARRNGRRVHESYRGTFSHRVALEDEQLVFFAFGAPLVDELVSMAAAPGFGPPLAVLESPEVQGPAVLAEYEIQCQGVRTSTQRLAYLWDGEDAGEPPRLDPPPDHGARRVAVEINPRWVEEAERSCRSAMYTELKARTAEFARRHQADLDEERQRAERRVALEVTRVQERLERDERLAARYQRTGTEDERRTLPLVRGRLHEARRRLHELEAEREQAVRELEQQRGPVTTVEPLGVVLVVPRGTLASLDGER